jgi:hypothetical protein
MPGERFAQYNERFVLMLEGGSMSYRKYPSQTVHDRVIADVAAVQTDLTPRTNPGSQRNWSVVAAQETIYPDLLLCEPGTGNVAHLIEVETQDSVTETESAQWAVYARGPGRFWLLVPSSSLALAQEICRRKGISANFGHWWLDGRAICIQWFRPAA